MKKTKIFAMILSVIMVLTIGVLPAFADNYAPVSGTTTTLHKYLQVKSNAEIPAAEFSFTVSAGSAVEATADTVKVWAGLNPELVKVNDVAGTGKVTFTAGESATTYSSTNADGYVSPEGTKAAVKDIELDFSGVSFPEPGVYRYILTENELSDSPIVIDEVPTRTVDVYVLDNNGSLEIGGYVVYSGTVEAAAGNEDSSATPASENKKTYYVNTLETYSLNVGKKVTGIQGSHDQYFEFTITIENAGAGTVMTIDASNMEAAPIENAATRFDPTAMETANSADADSEKTGQQIIADADGKAEVKVYLKHNQSIVIIGIPKDATYTVVETHEAGYEVTGEVTNSTALTADAEVEVVNSRGGSVPTGIIATIGTGLAIVAASGVGYILINRRKREDDEE